MKTSKNLLIISAPLIIIIIIIIITLGACTSLGEKQSVDRPNIIYIMSDDHAYQAISAYGFGLNETPNIDRLANEGAIFTRVCVTNSICAPSRAVLLTGKHSFVNGKVDNVQPFNWDQDNFPKLLRANGYETVMIGKIQNIKRNWMPYVKYSRMNGFLVINGF